MPLDYNFRLKTIGTFRFWCQKVLPAVYDDSLSYYELLCKVIEYLNNVIVELNVHSDAITELQELYAQLQAEFEKFKDNGFYDYYAEQVAKWIDTHMQFIYKHTIAQVFFRLDDSGYLIAHIPEGWEQIQFSTPMVYADQTSYGRLCLTYNMEGEYYEYDNI